MSTLARIGQQVLQKLKDDLNISTEQPEGTPIRRELSVAAKEIREIRYLRAVIKRAQQTIVKAEREVEQYERIARARITG